jgi:hypothetical protein
MTQECLKCEKELPDDRFSRDASRESGLNRYCKGCVKQHYSKKKPDGWIRKTADLKRYTREYRLRDPEKERERDRKKYVARMIRMNGPDWKPRGRLTVEEKDERRRARNRRRNELAQAKIQIDPEARKADNARKKLRKHVAKGKIVPLPCFICGVEAEAHHPSYDLPLDVAWLCSEHHRQAHRETKGLV